jgi:hypothetical protein
VGLISPATEREERLSGTLASPWFIYSDIFVNENENENENYCAFVHENENENENFLKNENEN